MQPLFTQGRIATAAVLATFLLYSAPSLASAVKTATLTNTGSCDPNAPGAVCDAGPASLPAPVNAAAASVTKSRLNRSAAKQRAQVEAQIQEQAKASAKALDQ